MRSAYAASSVAAEGTPFTCKMAEAAHLDGSKVAFRP